MVTIMSNDTKRIQTIMIIGGGWEQTALIKSAAQRHLRIVLTDPDHNCPGREWADSFYRVDPRDLPRLYQIAQAEKPQGITADECDYAHYAAVYLANRLDFANGGMQAAQYTTNKKWMREKVRDAEVMQPRFFACNTCEAAEAAVELIGLPVIVKPVDNRGAFGVRVIYDRQALKPAVFDAIEFSHSREILVEAFIEGVHITVDGCVDQQGKHHNLAVASKKIIPGDKPIITEVQYPAEISNEYYTHVLTTNTQVINALQIKAGLTHSEYIVDQRGRCFLVESANRGGGVLTSAVIVPHLSGVNLNNLLLANALNEPCDIEPVFSDRYCRLVFFVFAAGTVKQIKGVIDAQSLPGVLHLRLFIEVGQCLSAPQSGAGRHGFAILSAADPSALETLYDQVSGMLEVEYA